MEFLKKGIKPVVALAVAVGAIFSFGASANEALEKRIEKQVAISEIKIESRLERVLREGLDRIEARLEKRCER